MAACSMHKMEFWNKRSGLSCLPDPMACTTLCFAETANNGPSRCCACGLEERRIQGIQIPEKASPFSMC